MDLKEASEIVTTFYKMNEAGKGLAEVLPKLQEMINGYKASGPAETLVSQKFTEEKAIKIFRWLLGYGGFPDKKEGDPSYYWRSHLRAFLDEIGITKEVLEDSKFSG